MSDTPRSIEVRASAAALVASAGPALARYAMLLDIGRLYRWIVGSTATADDFAILSHTGGLGGRWQLVRQPVKGTNLTDASATIYIGGKPLRVLPTATLSANRVLTLGTTNTADGDVIRVVRLDVGAWTYALVNGGAGAGTLLTMPVSKRYWADMYFDGTNWALIGAGEMAT